MTHNQAKYQYVGEITMDMCEFLCCNYSPQLQELTLNPTLQELILKQELLWPVVGKSRQLMPLLPDELLRSGTRMT